MLEHRRNVKAPRTAVALLVALIMAVTLPGSASNNKKKKEAPAPARAKMDLSRFVWPKEPAIARVKFLDFFSAEKKEPNNQKKKSGWMDRMAGVSAENDKRTKLRFELLTPYGIAVDSKGLVYVADTKVGAIFIFNPETHEVQLIKHGMDAQFNSIFGLAVDDNDQLLVTDGVLHHVLVFDPNHKLRARFGDGVLEEPSGIAIDTENRLIYVADTGLDQIVVFDADSFKPLRTIGTAGKQHTLTTPGDFAKPTNVAVDQDGNLYVSDTLNNRVEIFDAEGKFIRTFGKNGDGPGDFQRPKGIAIDGDGHIWVADAMQCRLQVYTPDGQPLMAMGGFGLLPGQFQAPVGLAIDKKNRIFTTEQFPGRVQMFRYITNAEAQVEYDRRKAEAEFKKQPQGKGSAGANSPAAAPGANAPQPNRGVKPEAQKEVPPAAQNSPPQ
jgi:DNA-binding beta-propeller fold protein YncE